MKIDKFNEKKETVNKKTSKLKNALKITSLFAGSVAVGAVIGLTYSRLFFTSKPFVDENYFKNNKQIERDAEFLNADLTIMEADKNSLIEHSSLHTNTKINSLYRLVPNLNEKIYVYLNENLDDTMKQNINKSLNYCESLFTNINTDYSFQLVDETTYSKAKNEGKTVITYLYETTDRPTVLAENTTSFFNKNNYIIQSEICIDPLKILNFTSDQILFILNHELMHSFGFPDTYEGYKDCTSVMNAYNTITPLISPNDYKMLYSVYGNLHLNKNGSVNYDKFNQVKQKIDEYEKLYYDSIINKFYKTDVAELNKNELNKLQLDFSIRIPQYKNDIIYTYVTELDLEKNMYKTNIYKNSQIHKEGIEGKITSVGNNYAVLEFLENNTKKYMLLTKNLKNKYRLAIIVDTGVAKTVCNSKIYKPSEELTPN